MHTQYTKYHIGGAPRWAIETLLARLREYEALTVTVYGGIDVVIMFSDFAALREAETTAGDGLGRYFADLWHRRIDYGLTAFGEYEAARLYEGR